MGEILVPSTWYLVPWWTVLQKYFDHHMAIVMKYACSIKVSWLKLVLSITILNVMPQYGASIL
jgi:hypothetical protein